MIIKTRIEYFKEFLNYFWLRPENALMQTLRAELEILSAQNKKEI